MRDDVVGMPRGSYSDAALGVQPFADDPADPYRRTEQTFPRLTDDMVNRLRRLGREQCFANGSVLATPGSRATDFHVVLEGALEIIEHGFDGTRTVVVRHDRHQFTGELDLLNDRQSLVSAVAVGEVRTLLLDRTSFRQMMIAEPDIGEVVTRALILRRMGIIKHGHAQVAILGDGGRGGALRLQRFLTRNGFSNQVIQPHDELHSRLMADHALNDGDLPAAFRAGAKPLIRPSEAELADWVGLTEQLPADAVHDLVVVGAGPSGLAAAVYAASEGLNTLVVEGFAPGGQAGTSSRIENYLGFPTGISGIALAGRAHVQAQKFGARLAISRQVRSLYCENSPYCLQLEDGQRVQARAVVIATGARYRRLEVAEYEAFEGRGIHYAATAVEGAVCAGQEVVVVGGGNSAGQAAMFLSRIASHVHVLVRGEGLAATMSDYLVQRIGSSDSITLHTHTSVVGLDGDGRLEGVRWRSSKTGDEGRFVTASMFVMVGAEPNTAWLNNCVELDAKGFVETEVARGERSGAAFATSLPGVFAVGDVRARSIKRVASAVGEGSAVVASIHRFLAAE